MTQRAQKQRNDIRRMENFAAEASEATAEGLGASLASMTTATSTGGRGQSKKPKPAHGNNSNSTARSDRPVEMTPLDLSKPPNSMYSFEYGQYPPNMFSQFMGLPPVQQASGQPNGPLTVPQPQSSNNAFGQQNGGLTVAQPSNSAFGSSSSHPYPSFTYTQPSGYFQNYSYNPLVPMNFMWPEPFSTAGRYPPVHPHLPQQQQPQPWTPWGAALESYRQGYYPNNKFFPLIPQPMYPNGQPYFYGNNSNGYQFLTSCQAFCATMSDTRRFQATQYWNQTSCPPSQNPGTPGSNQYSPTQPPLHSFPGTVDSNNTFSPGYGQVPAGYDSRFTQSTPVPIVTEPNNEVAQDVTYDETSIRVDNGPTSQNPVAPMLTPPGSAASREEETQEDNILHIVTIHPHCAQAYEDALVLKETTKKGNKRARKNKRAVKKDLIVTPQDNETVNAAVEEPSSTTSEQRRKSKGRKSEDQQSRYNLRPTSQNEKSTPAPRGQKRSNAGEKAPKKKKSRTPKTEQAPDSSTSEVLPAPRSNEESVIVNIMKQWKLNSQDGETVLHRAASLGLDDVVAYCLRIGLVSSPNCVNSSGFTPLHEACSHGHERIARILLNHGAGPNKAAINGLRPIHLAQSRGYHGIVRALLEAGAEPIES